MTNKKNSGVQKHFIFKLIMADRKNNIYILLFFLTRNEIYKLNLHFVGTGFEYFTFNNIQGRLKCACHMIYNSILKYRYNLSTTI